MRPVENPVEISGIEVIGRCVNESMCGGNLQLDSPKVFPFFLMAVSEFYSVINRWDSLREQFPQLK